LVRRDFFRTFTIMKIRYITVILNIFSLFSQAQNLVPNASFEDTVGCPTNISQFNKVKFWVNPTQSTPDYFNACDPNPYNANVPYTAFGFQNARTGNAVAGFYGFAKGSSLREYVQVQLLDTLKLNHYYLVSLYVNKSDGSQYSISSLGVHFSSIPISSTGTVVLNYTPQIQNSSLVQLSDTVNWMLIEDTLLANGTEEYITIGNFKMNSQSDTVYLGWWSSNNIAYYYVDDVSVIDLGPLGIETNSVEKYFKVFPVPASEKINVEFPNMDAQLKIVDILGNELLNEFFSSKKQIDIREFPQGLYFVRLIAQDRILIRKFIKE